MELMWIDRILALTRFLPSEGWMAQYSDEVRANGVRPFFLITAMAQGDGIRKVEQAEFGRH
jgi:hypothetical protein